MSATPRIHRTWSDARRVEQFNRLAELMVARAELEGLLSEVRL